MLRARAIYVCEDRRVGEALLPESPGKQRYEVRFAGDELIHRADLRIYDEIAEALRAGRDQQVERLIRDLWVGAERPDPRIELAVARIRIVGS